MVLGHKKNYIYIYKNYINQDVKPQTKTQQNVSSQNFSLRKEDHSSPYTVANQGCLNIQPSIFLLMITNIYFESSDLLQTRKVVNKELRKVRKWLEGHRLALRLIASLAIAHSSCS